MTGRRRLLAAAIFLTGGLATAQSPQAPAPPPAPPPSGAISGVVVDGASGSPLSEVIVTITGGQLPPEYRKRQMSDARGRFAFINLPDSDTYQVVTTKFGHLEGGYGRDRGPTDTLRFVAIKNGAWVGNLKAPIWRPSTLSGAVRDETGSPVVGVFVRALARLTIAGHDAFAVGPMTVTDDRGNYRLSGLMPGRYVIQAPSVQMSVPAGTRVGASTTNEAFGAIDVDDTARLVIGRYPLPPPRREGRAMTYPAAFHPVGASVMSATTLEIKFSEDRPGIDIVLTPVAAVRVSGVVEAPPEAFNGLTLRLLPVGLEDLGLGVETATALVAPDGSFSFLNVPAGTYTLDAPLRFNEFTLAAGSSFGGAGSVGFGPSRTLPNPPPSGGWSRSGSAVDGTPGVSLTSSDFRNGEAPNYSGRTSVTVGTNNVTGVGLKLYPLTVVRGRFVLESDPAKPNAKAPTTLVPSLDPASGLARLGSTRGRAIKDSNNEFEITAVLPGEYWFRVQATDWLVKSVTWRGRDYTLTPMDTASAADFTGVVITMTNAVPTLAGSVRVADGSAPDAAIVVAFPVSPALRISTGLTPTRLRSATVMNNGSFSVTTLPAGEYFVAAIDRSMRNSWRNPEFLASLERQATRVTLSWGQTLSQNLTMVAR
jgi:hypothetical protein